MKQLFVTYNTETKKKERRQDIFKCCERKEDKINIEINCPSLLTTETPTNNTFNSSASSTINSSIDSKKLSLNTFSPDQTSVNSSLSINSNTNTNYSNSSGSNKFLGKKYKIHFDIIKNEDKKMLNISNSTNFNSSNSQSIDGNTLNKDSEKSESIELSEEKNNINDNNFSLIEDNNNDKEKISFLNEGRWSFKEHIKFIEAIAEYGKNWKDVQKYVGSRSSAQARSHAQKFFLKLKTIKTSKSDFDFSDNNIKSLSDIIEMIKKKDEYIKGGKQYIINTLIKLSESIPIENFDLCKNIKKKFKSVKRIKKEKEEEKKLEHNSFNNNNKIKNEIFNVFNDDNNDINNLKKEKTNISNIIDDNKNNEKQIDKSIIIKNNNKIEIKEIKNEIIIENLEKKKIDISQKDKIKENNNYNNITDNSHDEDIKDNETQNDFFELMNEPKKQKFIFDDGIIYLVNDSDFFYYNNFSLKLKEYISMKNSESPYLLFNKYFFS